MSNCLVTGGGGFIGSHLVRNLLSAGHNVRVLDNFSTGKRENLIQVMDHIELIEGDLRNMETVREAVKGIELIFHQAALPSVPRSIADPLSSQAVNEVGTLNILLAARDMGAKRVVFASSSSVYGNTPTLPKTEEMPYTPLSPYAVSKVAGELYSKNFYQLYGLETVSLRYFNVFGSRQDPASQYAAVIPIFITKLLTGQRPTIFGDGEQSRDFTYIRNVVEANVLAAASPNVAGEILNIATNQRITLNQLYEQLCRLINVDTEPVYVPPREGDVRHSLASISKAKELMDYRPSVTLEVGLERTIKSFQ